MAIDIQNILSTINFYFLYIDKYDFPKDWYFPSSEIPYTMLRYVIKGNANFVINGTSYCVGENDLVYIPEKSILECQSSTKFSFISLRLSMFSHDRTNDFISEILKNKYIYHCQCNTISNYFKEILEVATSKQLSRKLKIRAMIYLIFAWIVEEHKEDLVDFSQSKNDLKEDMSAKTFRKAFAGKQLKITDTRIFSIIEHILSRPTDVYTSSTLAKMACLSESSMRRLFKQQTGKSPTEFIRELKLTASARRLLVSEDRIVDIAYDMGFEDANYFARCFKKTFGISPSQYRKLEK